ncbi:MAG: arginine--tRNA ligase [Kiritimatiellae bacterium]|nr:arginine--tRNA ligase [Kiritimatiellia bacterium]
MDEKSIESWLRDGFSAAFPENDFSHVRALPATDAKFGDFQCNDALAAAKTLRQPPRKIAEAVFARLKESQPPFVEKLELAGPGFLNITVSADWLAAQLGAISASKHLNIPQTGVGKKVVIDYSSPNAAKQMHIGHIRSTVIGNAIDRIYRALGYDVIADNHLGDWGTQFGILIKGYRECLTQEERDNLTVANLEKCYVLSSTKAKEDEAWKNACREELVRLQQGDAEDTALWKRFIEISIAEFDRMYAKLGVKFDTYRGESYYNDLMPGVVERLKKAGLAEPSEGALIVRFDAEKLPVAIVQKSDGGFNYTTSDIACVESRVKDYDPERIIYVTDDRQQLHFRQFFAICAKLGCTTKLVHVPFGLMSYGGKAISTREGNLIKLDDLLAEAVRRSLEIVRGRPAGADAQDPAKGQATPAQISLAESIGFGAVKYADLSHDPATAIDFDWDKALALEGNSGPYLQYAYARVCSLMDKAAALDGGGAGRAALPGDAQPSAASYRLSAPIEKQLALQLLQFGPTVLRAAENYKPSVLADYLFQTAQLYSSFYQRSPILKSEPAVRDARLALCGLFGKVLAKGLSLLGMDAPPRI